MKFYPHIGLEIHVELKTATKLFCSCLNRPFFSEANSNICPICTGMPGALPMGPNEEAIKKIIQVGMALHSKISKQTFFDRKHYFYPDLPKSYQISQRFAPFCEGGYLEAGGKKFRIREAHLEEDAGKLMHDLKDKASLVDFNRAGVPLMELVTEPDFTSGDEVRAFAKELQIIFAYLDTSDANMERGEMRVEVNISLADAPDKLGDKVEIKNLNSLRAAKMSVDYEIERQGKILEKGDKVAQETRGWSESEGGTFSQRKKENLQDYKYFPDPNLPQIDINKDYLKDIESALPEMPFVKRARFIKEYKLEGSVLENIIQDKAIADYFENAVSEAQAWVEADRAKGKKNFLIKRLANLVSEEVIRILSEKNVKLAEQKMTAENLAELAVMLEEDRLSSPSGKRVLLEMMLTGKDPSEIIEEEGLAQISDANVAIVAAKKVIDENSKAIEDFKAGKANAVQFLIGKVMKETRGKVNPKDAQKAIEEELAKK